MLVLEQLSTDVVRDLLACICFGRSLRRAVLLLASFDCLSFMNMCSGLLHSGGCLTQKEPAGEKGWIFLINRTEHPRLAERVRCLCVGCDVTWGPPCQALVTRLPATRRR